MLKNFLTFEEFMCNVCVGDLFINDIIFPHYFRMVLNKVQISDFYSKKNIKLKVFDCKSKRCLGQRVMVEDLKHIFVLKN